MFLKFGVFAVMALHVSAQSPADLFSQAPPVVDQALRGRVSQFYQAHVDGKFRVADQFVAEESKDIFFEADKRRCRAFAIVRINYTETFDTASVVTNCDTEILIPPAGLTKVTMPMSSHWKLEGGEWFWYVPVKDFRESAFGNMKAGTGGQGMPAALSGPKPEDLMKMVTVDRPNLVIVVNSRVREELMVTNRLPGDVQLTLAKPAKPDLRATLEKTELKSGESAKLLLEFEADPAAQRSVGASEDIVVLVSPTGGRIQIRIQFVQQN
jgi:hypothetical protein